jgi:hypothetical protein
MPRESKRPGRCGPGPGCKSPAGARRLGGGAGSGGRSAASRDGRRALVARSQDLPHGSPARAAWRRPGRSESSRCGDFPIGPAAPSDYVPAAPSRFSIGPDLRGGTRRARGRTSGPAVVFPSVRPKTRSPPEMTSGGDPFLANDGAMSPAGRVPGSRPITHGCSTRDPRSGSPLPPFATSASDRRPVVDAPSFPPVCRVTAHMKRSRPGRRRAMAGMSRSCTGRRSGAAGHRSRTQVPACRFLAGPRSSAPSP